MNCPNCGCSGFYAGTACWSCGKGAITREPDVMARSPRGGREPRHYTAFGEGKKGRRT